MHFDAMLGMGHPCDLVRAVEQLDGDGPRRVLFGEGSQDVFAIVAAASQHAAGIELGTNVAIAFARTPMDVAYSAASLQALTGGRFVLGLGSQVRGHVVRRFGMPWSAPAARMEEFVRAIRAIWSSWRSGEELAFEGRFYQHTLMTPMFVPPVGDVSDPRICLAGVGPRMTEVAGRVADGYLSHPFGTDRSVATITLPALRAGCEASGRTLRDLEVTCALIGISGATPAEVDASREAARAQVAFYGSTPAYASVLRAEGMDELHVRLHGLSKQGRWDEMPPLVGDDLLDLVCVTGTPEDLVERAAARARGWATRCVVMPAPAGPAPLGPLETAAWYRRLATAGRDRGDDAR